MRGRTHGYLSLAVLGLLASCGDDSVTTSVGAEASADASQQTPAPGPDKEVDRSGMRRLPGGTFRYGPEQAYTYPVPEREASVESFWIDVTEVTNGAFAAFVDATGYVTDAERIGNAAVFDAGLGAQGQAPWVLVDGADWRHPSGPGSSIEGRSEHPVVQVSWNDAAAFAAWRGVRLPSDEEWEYAARGGLPDSPFPWGDQLKPGANYQANYWQGDFPVTNLGGDGFMGTAPVGRYAANGWGLADMGGNVWEWTAGGPAAGSAPPSQALATSAAGLRSVRGGSYLCRENAVDGYHACRGYLVNSRQFKDLSDGNSNVGFRCAADD